MATSSLGVQEVSTTSGVGPYLLGGPTPDHWRFADKIAHNSLVTYEANDTARSEYGLGRFEYPNTLHRQNIINSSESDQPVDWPVSGQCIISLVSDPGGGLPPGGDCAQALIKLSSVDYDAGWVSRPYPIAIWIDGTPGVGRRVRLAITEPVFFYSGFNGSSAYAGYPAGSDFTVTINRVSSNGTTYPLGSVTYPAGALIGSWHSVGPQQLIPGDRIEYLFPDSLDVIADLSITARGIIICQGVTAMPPEPYVEPPEVRNDG